MQYDQDGITEIFYELMDKLESINGFFSTLHKLDILTKDQMRVMYHEYHYQCIEQIKRHD